MFIIFAVARWGHTITYFGGNLVLRFSPIFPIDPSQSLTCSNPAGMVE
jgi:hypothetical protein